MELRPVLAKTPSTDYFDKAYPAMSGGFDADIPGG
jgi:hypothetical protein